jgi:hypothetical protein
MTVQHKLTRQGRQHTHRYRDGHRLRPRCLARLRGFLGVRGVTLALVATATSCLGLSHGHYQAERTVTMDDHLNSRARKQFSVI